MKIYHLLQTYTIKGQPTEKKPKVEDKTVTLRRSIRTDQSEAELREWLTQHYNGSIVLA